MDSIGSIAYEAKPFEKVYILHPLVLFNLSDHWMRQENVTSPIVGILFGREEDHFVHVYNSQEMVKYVDNQEEDNDFLNKEMIEEEERGSRYIRQQKGEEWGSITGEERSSGKEKGEEHTLREKPMRSPEDLSRVSSPWMVCHKEGAQCKGRTMASQGKEGGSAGPCGLKQRDIVLLDIHENPCFLQFYPNRDSSGSAVIADLFETKTSVIDGTPSERFIQMACKTEMTDIERIALDYTAKTSLTKEAKETGSARLSNFQRSIRILAERTEVILKFLRATKEGRIPMNKEILCEINAIRNTIASESTEALEEVLAREEEETIRITQLAALTKGLDSMHRLGHKYAPIKHTTEMNAE